MLQSHLPMHEQICIQVGQCGNQIGNEFWKKIAIEHKIDFDGTLIEHQEDRKDSFFYQSDDNRFIPRAILIDLEPRVVAKCVPFFNNENIYVPNGGGAGNNWAHGHSAGREARLEVLDMIQREVEGCDSLETFNLMHSVAGGTGSGFGSFVVEQLREFYSKKIVTSYSILPANEESSDVVVQPYNTILSLNKLNECCDNMYIMDNHSLGYVAMDSSRVKDVSMDYINYLVSTVISTSNSTIRFPTHTFCDSRSILNCTNPIPSFKILTCSYAPFTCDEMSKVVRSTTVSEVMRRLFLPKNRLCTFEPSNIHSSLSVFNILEGVKDPKEVSRAVELIFSKRTINFLKGMPPFLQTAISIRKPQFNRVSGLCINNNTGITSLLKKIAAQFDRLKNRNAFLDIYKNFDTDLTLFEQSRENLQNVIENYEKCEVGNDFSKII